MSAVNLVILLESVACASAHEDQGVDGVEAPVLGIVGVQVMDGGVTVLLGEDLQGAAVYLFGEVVAPADPLTIAVVVGNHLMLMAYHHAVAIVTTANNQPHLRRGHRESPYANED